MKSLREASQQIGMIRDELFGDSEKCRFCGLLAMFEAVDELKNRLPFIGRKSVYAINQFLGGHVDFSISARAETADQPARRISQTCFAALWEAVFFDDPLAVAVRSRPMRDLHS